MRRRKEELHKVEIKKYNLDNQSLKQKKSNYFSFHLAFLHFVALSYKIFTFITVQLFGNYFAFLYTYICIRNVLFVSLIQFFLKDALNDLANEETSLKLRVGLLIEKRSFSFSFSFFSKNYFIIFRKTISHNGRTTLFDLLKD